MAIFPSVAEHVLQQFIGHLYKNDLERVRIARGILDTENADAYQHIDDCFSQYICTNPYSGDKIFSDDEFLHPLVYTDKYKHQFHLLASHQGQWYIFFEVLLNSAIRFSKNNVAEHKDRKNILLGKIKQVNNAAAKLAKLMREIGEIEEKFGYSSQITQDCLELIDRSASTMKRSGIEREMDRAVHYEVMTKPELDKIHQWADDRRMPSAINLIEQIALDSSTKNLVLSYDTAFMEGVNHKFNVGLTFFFDEIKRYIKLGQLSPELTNQKSCEVWASIIGSAFGVILVRENVNTHLPLIIN